MKGLSGSLERIEKRLVALWYDLFMCCCLIIGTMLFFNGSILVGAAFIIITTFLIQYAEHLEMRRVKNGYRHNTLK